MKEEELGQQLMKEEELGQQLMKKEELGQLGNDDRRLRTSPLL